MSDVEMAKHAPIKGCRLCGDDNLILVIDLGDQYLSDFREDESKPPKAPLTLMMCDTCSLVQLAHTVDRGHLYTDNYGFRSGVNEGIVADLKSIVREGLQYANRGWWLDIASNDGTLLSFVPDSFYKVGVDPVTKFYDQAILHAHEIHPAFFSAEVVDHAKFDVVTSISMFYDIDDLNTFVAEVASVLAENGTWIIQQNYLYDMLRIGAIDNVCHEHLTYFSLNTLQNLLASHGLTVVSASTSPVNGGVLRTAVRHMNSTAFQWKGQRHTATKLLTAEREFGVGEPGTMAFFADVATQNLEKLAGLIDKPNVQNVDIYGASTRGAVLWQAAGIDNTNVQFAVERQPEKVGKWFSPIGVQIISEDEMREDPPRSLLVGPWWHRDAFIARERKFLKNGGQMIFPLPHVEIYSE